MPHAFEFDEAKSRANEEKYGIDFKEAQELWLADNLLRVVSRWEAEPRVLYIGRIGGKHWSAIATYCGETVRLISVRSPGGGSV